MPIYIFCTYWLSRRAGGKYLARRRVISPRHNRSQTFSRHAQPNSFISISSYHREVFLKSCLKLNGTQLHNVKNALNNYKTIFFRRAFPLFLCLWTKKNHELSRIETYFHIRFIQSFLPLNMGCTIFFSRIKFTSTCSAQHTSALRDCLSAAVKVIH